MTRLILEIGTFLLATLSVAAEEKVKATLYKNPLSEKPPIKGISLPGMPGGSPGMTGTKEGPFEVLSITGKPGPAPLFARE